MRLETKNLLESEGFEVIEGPWDFRFKTKIFIRHPDGRLNPYYEYLHNIPMLPNGQEFDLDKTAMPYDNLYGRDTAVKNAGALLHTEYGLSAGGLPIPIIIGQIILAIILLAIVICIFYILHPPVQEPPCGTSGKVIEISDCAKIIIMPNCDSRLFDSCQDEWLEDDWHTWEPPAEWTTYLIIGIAIIGAILIIPPLLRAMRPAPQPPTYPPPDYRLPPPPPSQT